MKNYNVLILIASALLLSAYACKQSKKMANSEGTEKSEKTEMPKEQNQSAVQNVIVEPKYMADSTDTFTLLESTVNGDILSLLVQYGGGCETHEWALKTNGHYAKSLPPQITLNIEHNANGDMCRALLRDTLEFNLENIKYPGTSQLMVNLKGFKKHSNTYSYK